MATPETTDSDTPKPEMRSSIPLSRRLAYAAIIYLSFLLLLVAIEIVTRWTMSPVSSLDLFVVTPQQKAQVADEKQSTIFEGDPLLLWRLKPNLDHVVWDFTVLSTNSEHLRADTGCQIDRTHQIDRHVVGAITAADREDEQRVIR